MRGAPIAPRQSWLRPPGVLEGRRSNTNADAVEEAVWAKVVEILEDPELLKEAAGLSATEDDHRVLDRDIAAAERELKTFERQKQNLLRLYCKGLAEEQELEQQLNEIRAQQRATEQRCDSLLSQREAAALMRQTRTTSVSG